MVDTPIRVLFICTGNVCRSQLAEGLLRKHGGDRFDVHSAGMIPSNIHPLVIRALAEEGIDASGQESKHWGTFSDAEPFDYVITLCDYAAPQCPVYPPRGQRLHWPIDDPISATGTLEERLSVFREIRDEIAGRIRQFVEETRHN